MLNRRSRSWALRGKQSSLLDLPANADKSNLLDQIFQFIGSKPEKAVSWCQWCQQCQWCLWCHPCLVVSRWSALVS